MIPRAGERRSGLTTFESVLFQGATVLVGGTGIVYAVFRYLVTSADPDAIVNHPWQPAVQHLHVLFAPLLVFAAGLIFRPHVLALWFRGTGARRFGGIASALTLAPVIASGYLLQIAVEDSWRGIWGVLHTATSLGWIAAYGFHFLTRRGPGPGAGSA